MDKNKLPSFVTIAMLTLITLVFWIFFSVFRLLTTKPATQVPDEVLEPISPVLDKTALDKLQQRIYVPESELTNLPVLTPSPRSTPIATPTSSPAATIQPSPQATTQP